MASGKDYPVQIIVLPFNKSQTNLGNSILRHSAFIDYGKA
jgi:hypothetical protein